MSVDILGNCSKCFQKVYSTGGCNCTPITSFTKSYTLTKEQQAKVDKMIAGGENKYKNIEHIIVESSFDAGPFFEHEIDED